MERNIQVFCPLGHEVIKLCVESQCKHVAIVCNEEECQFFSKHEECFTVGSQILIEKLLKKGASSAQLTDPIIQFYKCLMKKISRDLSQYQKSKPQSGFRLFEDENKLFNLLRLGNVKNIFPQLICNVNKSLKKKSISQQDRKIQNVLEEQINKIDKVLQYAKQIWKKMNEGTVNVNQLYRFSDDLYHRKYSMIKQNNKVVQFNLNSFSIALANPSIKGDTKIMFKIRQLGQLYLCLVNKDNTINNNFLGDLQINSKMYGVSDKGKMLSHLNQQQHQKQSTFFFKANNIVEIYCNMTQHKLIFTNKTISYRSLEIEFDKQQLDNMNFGLWGLKSTVEIVD